MATRQQVPDSENNAFLDSELSPQARELLEQGTGPDCSKCVCRAVCTLYKAVEPALINGFAKGDQPFNVVELAKICKFYYVKPKE